LLPSNHDQVYFKCHLHPWQYFVLLRLY
jgi:hypothetical protein